MRTSCWAFFRIKTPNYPVHEDAEPAFLLESGHAIHRKARAIFLVRVRKRTELFQLFIFVQKCEGDIGVDFAETCRSPLVKRLDLILDFSNTD